jgi:hypothetical protein
VCVCVCVCVRTCVRVRMVTCKYICASVIREKNCMTPSVTSDRVKVSTSVKLLPRACIGPLSYI